MQLYSQRDPRWSGHVLGWGPALGTIGAYGCLDTVDAMIATDCGHRLNPAELDQLFTDRGVFVRESSGTFDLLPDDALARVFPADFAVSSFASYRGDLIKAAVPSPDTYAVLWIATAAVPTHFVLAASADGLAIIDPWTGAYGTLAGYGGPAAVHKTVLVKHLSPEKPAAPVPVPVPTPPPALPLPVEPKLPPASIPPPVVAPPVHNPPVELPPVPPIELPPLPEPPPVAEAGVTTSEWKLAVRYLVQLLAVGTVAVFVKLSALACPLFATAATCAGFHPSIPPDLLSLIVSIELAGAGAVASYAISRGIRKHGAQ